MSERTDSTATCTCAVPVPVERAERKGASRRHCARWGVQTASLPLPLPLTLATPPRYAA